MTKNKTQIFIGFMVMLAMAIACSVISAVTFGAFAYFELFYLLCLAAGGVLLLTAEKAEHHLLAGFTLVSVGLFVNMLLWGIDVKSGLSGWLNLVAASLTLLCAILLLHGSANLSKAKTALTVASSLHILLIVVLAIYNLADGLAGTNSTLLNACYIVQNASLLSTVVLPLFQIRQIKP